MKSSIFRTFFVLAVCWALIVQGQAKECTCGNLGPGTSPCTCNDVVVKAAKLPKPAYYRTPEEINGAAAARSNTIVISPSTTQSGCSESQSNANTIVISQSNSQTQSTSDSSAYSGGSAIITQNIGGATYPESDATTYSDSNTFVVPSTSSSSADIIDTGNTNAASETTTTGCGCNKAVVESLEINDSSSSDDAIVPSFPPIGDLCYPLPINPRNGKIVEKAIVTPAYPGKIVCNCDSSPYQICINTQTGETVSKTLITGASTGSTSDTSAATDYAKNGVISGSFGGSKLEKLNTGIFAGSSSGAFSGINSGSLNSGFFGGSVPKSFSGSRAGSLNSGIFGSSSSGSFAGSRAGSLNSGIFGSSSSGSFAGSRAGSLNSVVFGDSTSEAFSRSKTSGAFSAPTSGIFTPVGSGVLGKSTAASYSRSGFGKFNQPPLVYAGSYAQKPHAAISQYSSTSSDSFDDDLDVAEVDSTYPQMPADAVSLTLAYKNLRAPNVVYRQGKQFVPEDKLSFGHRTVPKEVKTEEKIIDIPEEKLVIVDKPVVELKVAPPRTVVIGSYDEREEAKLAELEAIERESITQEETADQVSDSLLTYKDLGYAPVGATFAKSARYSDVINGDINDSVEIPFGPLGPTKPDYVPGTVIVQQELINDNSDNSGAGIINGSMEILPPRSGSCPQ